MTCIRVRRVGLGFGGMSKYPVKYLGWIYGNLGDEQLLRSLGIEGAMNWKPCDNSNSAKPFAFTKKGIFEMCEISPHKAPNILHKLNTEYFLFDSVTFTGVDERGKSICGLNWRNGQPAYGDEWRKQNV